MNQNRVWLINLDEKTGTKTSYGKYITMTSTRSSAPHRGGTEIETVTDSTKTSIRMKNIGLQTCLHSAREEPVAPRVLRRPAHAALAERCCNCQKNWTHKNLKWFKTITSSGSMCPQPNRTNPNKVLRKCSSYQQLKQFVFLFTYTL